MLKTTLRHLGKNRMYTLLNIAGLAIGVACAALIFLWVEDEMNYDNVFPKKALLYHVETNETFDGVTRTFISTPAPLASAMQQDFREVADVSNLGWFPRMLVQNGDKGFYEQGTYADPGFWRMFQPPFAAGGPGKEIHDLVVSERVARKFFSSDDAALGQTLRLDNKQDFKITGVIKDLPKNSTLQFDWVASFAYFAQGRTAAQQTWGVSNTLTYVELKPGVDPAQLNKRLGGYIASKDSGANAQLFLFPMKDWQLRNNFQDGKQTGGLIETVHLFTVIAWIILLIACINFMNLATARSEQRAKEVGVRKVIGAQRRSLVAQFLGESLLLSAAAVALGILLVEAILPLFNDLVGQQLAVGLDNPLHLAATVGIAVLCGLLAGSYPSLYLSSFRPVVVFKGLKTKNGSATLIRKGMVVFQFTISIVLIIGTVIVYQQVQHIKHRDLGYNKDGLIEVPLTGTLRQHFEAIRQDLLSNGAIDDAGLTSTENWYTQNNSSAFSWAEKDPNTNPLISRRYITPDYFTTLQMRVLDGRNFLGNPAADTSNVVITQTMARLMGKGSAVGKYIRFADKDYRVVGVVNDYVYGDMYGQPDPVVFWSNPDESWYMFIRLKTGIPIDESLRKIGDVLQKDNPSYPFDYSFVDTQFDDLFKSETLVGRLAWLFAALAVAISCLGLFGLSAFTAERRKREIGIRKVLGASVTGIVQLLSADFLRLVCLSVLIAFPISWWAMHAWLQNYAYRIGIHAWVFAAAGAAAFAIALATISIQSILAARANPVKSLRTE